jgi:hypothetical protein
MSEKPIQTVATPAQPPVGSQHNLGTVAFVDGASSLPAINVSRPDLYTPAIAAHEATHLYQNSRNPYSVENTQATHPTTDSLSNYDYGGIKGIQSSPLKSVGDYNPEQQAQMVQNLTQAQSNLHPGMSPHQLDQWDTTKNTLERPIRQLQMIPPPDTSFAGRADGWLNRQGIAGGPIEHLKSMISPPSLQTQPQPIAGPPSRALGYPLRSNVVR